MPKNMESGEANVLPPLRSGRNLGILGLVGATFILLLVLALSGISSLTTIRGYIVGEGIWSKAQKQSVSALHRYARTGAEEDWWDFEANVAVMRGDQMAREELERPEPDMDVVMRGFEEGLIPEPFRRGMATLFRRGGRVEFVSRAIDTWEEADVQMGALRARATVLREVREGTNPDQGRIADLLIEIEEVDGALTVLEAEFTDTLNEGAFVVERILRWVLLGIATVVFLGAGATLRYLYVQVLHREEVLERSEGRYRALFEESIVGTLLVSEEGIVTRANAAFARMLGYDSPEDIVGRPTTGLYVDPGQRSDLIERLDEKGVLFVDELLVQKRDGAGLWIMSSSVIIDSDDGGRQILVTAVDISSRKEMELRLARKGRMEAMGQLAGGIAHDFNNLLTAILGNASLLQAEFPGPDSQNARQILSEIVSSSGTAAELTEQLLAFSRGDPTAATYLDVADLVVATQSLLVRLLPESIVLETELTDGPTTVKAPPAQLKQVLLNLVINSRDAMPDGGRIVITVDRVTIESRTVDGPATGALEEPDPGEYVRLTVADTGPGIEAEMHNRLFEPFFSTKPEGAGTGMGLATVYGVVTRAGGTVYVEPSESRGATFRVLLPWTVQSEAAAEVASSDTASRGGDETLLLVEDDDAVRRVARRILEHAGYRVLEAANGSKAFDLVESGVDFDFLLTDVVMPDMGGVELASRVVEMRPEVPVLFVSGYSRVTLQNEALQSAVTDSLAKPFTPAMLVERVQSLLERARVERPT